MTRNQRLIAAVFALTVLARLLFHQITGFTYDDAFITFRYAENIAAGHGFVYNADERVLGITTPLFTLLLAALAWLGLPVIGSAVTISLICSGLTAILLYRLARSLDFGRFSCIPVTMYIFFPRLIVTDTAGMETAFFTFLVTGALYWHHRNLTTQATAAAAYAAFTRPEGFLVLAILGAYNLVKHPPAVARYAVVAAMIVVPWIVFASFYFGSPVPNSITAKLALYHQVGIASAWGNLEFLMGWHRPLGIPLFLLVVSGGWWLVRTKRFGLPEILWMTGLVVPLAVSRTYVFLWYVTPIYPVYFLFAGAAFPLLKDRWQWFGRHSAAIQMVILAVIVVVLAGANYTAVSSSRSYRQTVETVHKAAGEYLHSHAADLDTVIAEDFGYLGYYSKLRIIDRDGLVSPEIIPYIERGDYLGAVMDSYPEWVALWADSPTSAFIYEQTFTESYQLRMTFPSRSGREYQIYARKDKTDDVSEPR